MWVQQGLPMPNMRQSRETNPEGLNLPIALLLPSLFFPSKIIPLNQQLKDKQIQGTQTAKHSVSLDLEQNPFRFLLPLFTHASPVENSAFTLI
jgi:hypothetical protein